MKKLLTAFLVLTLVLSCSVAIFAGCTPPTDYERTIVFYSSQGDSLQQKTKIAIEAFEAKYPGWKVIHTPVGGYDQVKEKVVSDLQAGKQPDLAYCYADHVAQYIQTGKVVDLNKYLTSEETVVGADNKEYRIGFTDAELADFVQGYYEEGYASNYTGYEQYGFTADSMLTLPFVKSTELLYYNKTALDACGLTPATTWDELWAQCETLVDAYPTCTPLGYDSEANWFISMCQQNGWGYTSADANNHYLFNNNDAKEWLAKLAEYYDKGYITTQEESGAYTSALFIKGVDDGGLVYCVGSSGGASHQNSNLFEWGITSVPGSVRDDGTVDYSVISQGPSLVMLTGGNGVTNATEKEKMTFLFIKELMDPAFQATFSMESGYNPSRNSVYELDAYIEHMNGTDITAVAAKVAATLNERYFTSPAFVGSSTARIQVGNALLNALTGKKTPEKALADAYSNCGGK